MEDRSDLQRFVLAQDPVYRQVLAELCAGRKRTHWMWFIFPQIEGIGQSEMSHRFAISSIQEAADYLHHPILGPRLIECTGLVNKLWGHTAYQVFGDIDCRKFHACMTLFCRVGGPVSVFHDALGTYFDNLEDEVTARLLLDHSAERSV